MPPKSKSCDHAILSFKLSPNAAIAGYKEPTLANRSTAASAHVARGETGVHVPAASTYPAPLIIPEDELSWDPKYGVQTYRSWLRLKERNRITPERRTVYFVGPPALGPGLEHVKKWGEPVLRGASTEKLVPFPGTEEILDYLKAFYHGLPVKMLTTPKLQFSADDDEPKAKVKGGKIKAGKKTKTETLWLNTKAGLESIGIQTRATPDRTFSHQLNLNDLLDAAIDMLPDDAYALLMLVEHDIFEDEEDDFACGRAYGAVGSL